MSHYESELVTSDGLHLYEQGWDPEHNPKAVVCLVHGHGEHSGRYTHVATALNQAGYTLLAFDLRGHGRSEGPRGHSPSFEIYMDDIDRLLRNAEQRYPGLPCFIYGHSLGGLLALLYVIRYKPILAGVIATAPLFHTPLENQTLKVTFTKIMASFFPTLALSSGLDPNTLSRDPEVVSKYISDPLVHNRISLRMANDTLREMTWTLKHANEFSIPLLLMDGTDDRLVYPSGCQEFASSVPGDCTFKLWEELYHELHNEPEKELVLAYIVGWLNSKI